MLKVKFWRIENVVLMKVLEQGEEIKRGNYLFYSDKITNIELYSINSPEIEPSIEDKYKIYVCGHNSDSDSKIATMCCSCIDEAKDFYNRAVQTIRNYNNLINSAETTKDVEYESTIAE